MSLDSLIRHLAKWLICDSHGVPVLTVCGGYSVREKLPEANMDIIVCEDHYIIHWVADTAATKSVCQEIETFFQNPLPKADITCKPFVSKTIRIPRQNLAQA